MNYVKYLVPVTFLLLLFRVVILAIINISVSLSSARAGVPLKCIFKTYIYFEIYHVCNKGKTITIILIVTVVVWPCKVHKNKLFLLNFEEIILFFEILYIFSENNYKKNMVLISKLCINIIFVNI